MAELTTAVCSIAATQRRRYFWAAWWTGEPSYAPFRKPDAANGGARSRRDALAQAERAAGRTLSLADDHWAQGWMRVLRGQAPIAPASTPPRAARQAALPDAQSAWSVLGIEPGAAADAVRRAFHRKALETHPDHGGNATEFRAVLRAFERLSRKAKPRKHKRA